MQGNVSEFTVHTLRPTLNTIEAVVEVSITTKHSYRAVFVCTKQLSCV